MRVIIYALLSCLPAAALLGPAPVRGETGKVAAATFGGLPTVSEAEISPDGRTLARLQNVDGMNAVAFIDLEGKKAPVGMQLTSAKGRGLRWVGPEHIMLLVSGSTTIS